MNDVVAIYDINEFEEQTLMVSILPDVRSPKIKNRFLKHINNNNHIDHDPNIVYENL